MNGSLSMDLKQKNDSTLFPLTVYEDRIEITLYYFDQFQENFIICYITATGGYGKDRWYSAQCPCGGQFVQIQILPLPLRSMLWISRMFCMIGTASFSPHRRIARVQISTNVSSNLYIVLHQTKNQSNITSESKGH